jgi:hypothetical protein
VRWQVVGYLLNFRSTTLITLKYRISTKQLSRTRYKQKNEQTKRTTKEQNKSKEKPKTTNPSETDAMVNIVSPCSSLHQILNYGLFPICRFTDEVGNMQRLLKPTLQLHLRRSLSSSPELPEAIATLLTQQIYIIWHLSCRIFHSQDHVLWYSRSVSIGSRTKGRSGTKLSSFQS